MILNELFESRMSELDIEYQDWKNMEPVAFYSRYKISKDEWARRHWSLIKGDQNIHEESQTDRNARIIAGEIEDAVLAGNKELAMQKLKELMKLGYYLDSNGQLQAMGMYEDVMENLRKWFKEKWVRFGPDGKIRGDCARGSSKEGKPKCLPQAKAHALGKKGRASAAAKKRREDPNPERRGAAKNVSTKVQEQELDEKQDACYRKVKSRYKVWPSAYASGALVQCRKKGAANWGKGSKK